MELKISAKANVIFEGAVFSLATLENFISLVTENGLKATVVDGNRVQIGRDDTNPCPENCPPIPLLTVNSGYRGYRNVNLTGDCNAIIPDQDNHKLVLNNWCAPCCDCDQQAHVSNGIAETIDLYNKMVDELITISEEYNNIRSKLLSDAIANNDTIAQAEIAAYMPDNLFVPKT